MTLRTRLLAFTSFLLTVFGSSAEASTIGAVGSAKVEAGKAQAGVRLGYSEADESSSQDERFRSRINFDYAFNDIYAANLILMQDMRKGDSYEHDAIKLENRFQLLKAEKYGFDFGVRASYSHKDGDKKPSNLEGGLYALVPYEGYELRLNQIFDHDVGEDAGDGVGAEFRFQATHPVADGHRLGVEGFHDFGNLAEQSGYSDQSHTIGPVLKGKLFEGISYEAGYRAGISKEAPDHSVKLFLSKNF